MSFRCRVAIAMLLSTTCRVFSFRAKRGDNAASPRRRGLAFFSGTRVSSYTFAPVYWRPNYFKQERCTGESSDTCEECVPSSTSEGYDCMTSWAADTVYNPLLVLNVQDMKWRKFLSVLEVKCPKHKPVMILIEFSSFSEHFDSWTVFANGKRLAPVFGQRYEIDLSGHQGAMEIQVEYVVPLGQATPYTAGKVSVAAVGDLDDFLHCEDNQVCLSKLPDFEEGRTLRNSNELQLLCLSNSQSALAEAGEVGLVSTCNTWRQCLQESDMQAGILRILTAGSLAGVVSNADGGCVDAPGCVDPRFTDPEGWACNCLDEWTAKCEAIGYSNSADCFTAAYCLADLVCDCWKASACERVEVQMIQSKLAGQTASLVQKAKNVSASLMEKSIGYNALLRQRAGIKSASAQFDETLTSKSTC